MHLQTASDKVHMQIMASLKLDIRVFVSQDVKTEQLYKNYGYRKNKSQCRKPKKCNIV